jgi:hypothetical protein
MSYMIGPDAESYGNEPIRTFTGFEEDSSIAVVSIDEKDDDANKTSAGRNNNNYYFLFENISIKIYTCELTLSY